MADLQTRPLYNAPGAIVVAGVSIDPDGTVWVSDETTIDLDDDGADADIRDAPQPPPLPPGFHPNVRVRVDSYSNRLPGNWLVTKGGPFMRQWRARASDVYWERAPTRVTAESLFALRRLPRTPHKVLTPALHDDIRLIAAIKDRNIGSMEPLIVTARARNVLLKSDIHYFLLTSGIIEHRMMDALFAAVACVPDVQGPVGYDYETPWRGNIVALPSITWNHIYRKFRHLEGEGLPPSAIPDYLPGPIDPSTEQPGDPTNIHSTVKAAHGALLPILLDGDHWMFAFINFTRRTVLIVNSDPKARDAQEQYRKVEKYLHYWNLQNLSGAPHEYPRRWQTVKVAGTTLKNTKREQGSGLGNVLGALLVVCDVNPAWEVPVDPVDLRAFFAVVLSVGGFRGDIYFPHQDAGETRPWDEFFGGGNRGFWYRMGRVSAT